MSILTVADITTGIDIDPRIRDLRLAEALGFKNIHAIRPLIARHIGALQRFGAVSLTQEKPGKTGGRPGQAYYLNRKQALFITAKSDTDRSADIAVEMVEVFDAHLSGTLKPSTGKAVAAVKALPPRTPAKRRPGKFEAGSDILKDLVNVVRSAMYRVEHGSSPSFDRALHETLEDIQARKERPAARTRGVLLDHDYDRAHDDLVDKLKAEGRDVKPRYRPTDRTDEVATRTAH